MLDEKNLLRYENLTVTPVIPVDLLGKAYYRMQAEGTLGTVFFQGIPTIKEFLDAYLAPGKYIVLGCFRENPDCEPEFCGIGWAMNATSMSGYVKAECGIVMFRTQATQANNVAFGRMMLQMFFDRHKIDCIFGTTPDANKLALRYAKRIGMELHGPIPDFCTWQGKPSSAWISKISKQQFLEQGR